MRESFLPFSPPAVGEEEIAAVAGSLRSGWLTTGPRVREFERKFADAVGAPDAIALNSGTAAMHVALAALGIKEGDEVITTTITFASTAHVVEHLGAKPVLVDVEADTLNIDPKKVEAAVTERTKAVLPVHLYGHPCEMDSLIDIARRHGLAVVEDAAHAYPAAYRGRPVGSLAEGIVNAAAYSFYATKNLTTGEGGMLTGPSDLIDRARTWALHGMSKDAYGRYAEGGTWRYDIMLPGFKYNMPEAMGAIGLVQMARMDEMQQRRSEIVERYNTAFRSIEELEIPTERPEVESARHIYPLRLQLDVLKIDRDQFINELAKRKIGSSVHFIPVHQHTYYREKYNLRPEDFPVAEREFARLISIPLSPALSDQDVGDVIDAVRDIVVSHSR